MSAPTTDQRTSIEKMIDRAIRRTFKGHARRNAHILVAVWTIAYREGRMDERTAR